MSRRSGQTTIIARGESENTGHSGDRESSGRGDTWNQIGRKRLQYQDVFRNQTYKARWDIPNLLVLNVTTNEIHMRNIMAFLRDDLKGRSRSLLFKALPTLSSSEKSPQPVLSLLTDPWQRVGHEPFRVGKEVT
jgi:hypothetical protein